MKRQEINRINDINQCVFHAQQLAKHLEDIQTADLEFIKAFTSLAGDEFVGMLAYAIWRDRSRLFSELRTPPTFRYDTVTRVRHTHT